jgi:hypothetical protein
MTDDGPSPKGPSPRPKASPERESRNAWEDEGGSVDERLPRKRRYADRPVSGRIVQAGGSGAPFKVELTHEDGHKSEHLCATMREGEAFIRDAIPTPAKRDTSRDRPADSN